MANVKQQYQETTDNEDHVFSTDDVSWGHGAGQTFTASSGYLMGSFVFKLRKSGTPDYVYRGALYATSSGLPTGSSLATTSNFNVSDLTTTATDKEFTFSTPYLLSNGVVYAIVLEYVSGSSSYPNDLLMSDTIGDTFANGSQIKKSNLDVWVQHVGGARDTYFQVWSTDAPGGSARRIFLIS